ncbi:ERO1-like protein beta [Nymphon striatum]|nr:ERO1-like protein beta [Nymphon striatum]
MELSLADYATKRRKQWVMSWAAQPMETNRSTNSESIMAPVNLDRKCPFWEDDSKCSLRDCSVQACTEDQVPPGLKGNYKRKPDHKYSKSANNQENCEDDLGALNNTIR